MRLPKKWEDHFSGPQYPHKCQVGTEARKVEKGPKSKLASQTIAIGKLQVQVEILLCEYSGEQSEKTPEVSLDLHKQEHIRASMLIHT